MNFMSNTYTHDAVHMHNCSQLAMELEARLGRLSRLSMIT